MRVKVEFEKTDKGLILASIRVVKRGKYSGIYIFGSAKDHPNKDSFKLYLSEENCVCETHDSAFDAKMWVGKQLKALKAHYQAWIDIECPDGYEINLIDPE